MRFLIIAAFITCAYGQKLTTGDIPTKPNLLRWEDYAKHIGKRAAEVRDVYADQGMTSESSNESGNIFINVEAVGIGFAVREDRIAAVHFSIDPQARLNGEMYWGSLPLVPFNAGISGFSSSAAIELLGPPKTKSERYGFEVYSYQLNEYTVMLFFKKSDLRGLAVEK